MLSSFFQAAIGFLTDMFNMIGQAFSGVVNIFYTSGENPQLTFVGQVLAAVLAASLVGAAIYVIVRLVKAIGGRISGAARKVA